MENMNEQWKEIPGMPGYFASNLGEVKGPRKIIKGHYHNGYVRVICRNQKIYRRSRLVALTWIPNPYDKPEVDHINGKRDDDRIENLRWVTHTENINNPVTKVRMLKSAKRRWEREKSEKKVSRN